MFRFFIDLITASIDALLIAWEEKRKGKESHEFCENCIYSHEYRIEDRMVYIRCKTCLHVTKKRPMTGKELVDMLHYQEQEELAEKLTQTSTLEPDERNGGHPAMENDGTKYMTDKERKRKIAFCEDMTQFYRTDKNVQFHLLPDYELQAYVDMYKYDQQCETCLDEMG